MKENSKNQNGITLIALVITIIVLLILAMVSIKLVWDGGIIAHAQNAVNSYNEAQTNELEQLNILEEQFKQYGGSNNSQLQDGWWEFKDEKEKEEILNNNISSGEFQIAFKQASNDYRFDKMVSLLVEHESETTIIHYITVGKILESGELVLYICPITDLAIQSFKEKMQEDNVSFILEKGKWFTLSNGGSHFASNDSQYTGPSPIQLSDFTENEIFCKSYLERVIASFNN